MTQLAKMMRDRRTAGGAPYVLLLGSSLSLTPAVRRAVCGSEDWETFWTAVERMSPAERRAAFKGPLERLLLAEGYCALTRLLAAGYFEVIFTLNVDDTLDDELRVLKADEYRIWVYGEVTSAELVAALEYRSPRVKVLKLRGDVNAHKLPLTPEGQFEFHPDLEHAARQWLSRDTMVVGDLPFDDDVWRCLRGGDGALWVVQTSEVSETSEVLRRAKKVRQKGEAITAESFNAFFTALADALEVEEVKPAWELPPQNPYQGLEAFTQDKAPFFFGRERLTEKLLERLRRERFLAVVGASGSGKSSVVQAGLLHRLAQGALPGSTDWPTLVCRPGELVDALARLLQGTEDISADERQDLLARVLVDETAIHAIAERTLQDAPPDHRLVLVVDQFEELFTLESPKYQEQIIAALLHAVRVAGGRTTVVVTLRADFYARVAEYDELFVWMEQRRVFVPPMSETELREAIQRPARLVKFPLDDTLTDTILKDVGKEPGALPLLQYALKELYDRWQEGLTPPEAYREIGGVQGALEHRADEVYQGLSERQQVVARHILIRLTQLGEGTEDTRRRMTFEDLATSTITLDEIEEVVGILAAAQNRLLVTDAPDKERPGQKQVAEVAHEALIRGWKRLQDWLNEDRAGLLLRQRLGERAREWDVAGQHEDYLYRGLELGRAREWAEAHEGELSELEQAFLDASVEAEERAARGEEARRRRELEQAQALARAERQRAEESEARRRAEEQRTQEAEARAREQAQAAANLRKRALLAAGAGIVAVLLAIAASVFGWHSYRNARVSLSRQLAAQATSHLDDELDLALLLSLVAYRTDKTFEAKSSLLTGLEYSSHLTTFLHGHAGPVQSVDFSPDGKTLASASEDHTIILWDIETRLPVGQPLTGHTFPVQSVAFSPDGQTLASGSCRGKGDTTGYCNQGEIRLWNVATRQPLDEPLNGHTNWVYGLAFSPDGKMLASGSEDDTIILWDIATREPLGPPLTGHTALVHSVAFSPDGQTLASGSWDNTVILWDVVTHQPLGPPLTGHRSWVSSVTFSPDGQTLASGSWDRTIILWDIATRQHLGPPLPGHALPVQSVDFSPDGKMLASASEDHNIILWDVAARLPLGLTLTGHMFPVQSVAFSPDGQMLASGSCRGKGNATETEHCNQGEIRLWNVATRQPLGQPLIGHTSLVNSLAFSPDGKMLASGSEDQTIILWDVVTHQPCGPPLTDHTGPVSSVAFSTDGKMLASGSWDNTIILWDVTARWPLGPPLIGNTYVVQSVAFSSDGKTLAGSWASDVILWDVATHRPLGPPLTGHAGTVPSVAFSPDGKTLASGSWDNTIILWDVATGQSFVPHLIGHASGVSSVAFSPDGQTLASGSWDNTVILWDVTTHQPLGLPFTGHRSQVSSVTFSPGGKILASGGGDNAIILWDIDLESWQARACSIANRNLTHAEWQQYLGNEPYRPTCSNLPVPEE